MKGYQRVNRFTVLGLIVSAMILGACRQQAPATPPPTWPVPSAVPSFATPTSGQAIPTAEAESVQPGVTPVATPDALATVRQRGRLIVGTSADYPPFAFYTDTFELDGYDIALARLLADQLGVEVQFNDMAFDGLGGALQIGQIDAAIAAISVTDERRETMDFSNIYYVGEGAALVRAGSGITINDVADLAPYRVAVQDGSVYQRWLEEEAIAPGLLPLDNLLVYSSALDAVGDLTEGRIDVVIADSLPLELAAQEEAVTIAGRGLNRQRMAVALARGSALLSPINEALFELQNRGELARLAEEYLNIDGAGLHPLPTPEATAQSAPEPSRAAVACIDAMTLIAHLSLDDEGMRSPPPVSPGTPFQKSWRIQNNGTCPWTSGYLLVPVGGNVPLAGMGGAATPIRGTIAPGQSYDITVELVAPLVPGVYQGFWSMRNPSGLLFGERIWVGITVPAQATPTPQPTIAPSASVTFSADRTSVRAGECVTFNWSVSNAAATYFYAQGQPWELNEVQPVGNRVECPGTTTSFNLRVVAQSGSVDIRSIRVDVEPSMQAPVIDSFTVTPGFQIALGQCIDVRWRVSGDVTNIRVARNETTLWNGAPLSGTSRDCPPAGEMAYSIEATGPGGVSRAQQTVTVQGPPVTATPNTPIINSFSIIPNQIPPGACVSIAWSVSGSAGRIQLFRDGVLVLDFAAFTGNIADCLNNEGAYVYRIEATGNGQLASQQATVTVSR